MVFDENGEDYAFFAAVNKSWPLRQCQDVPVLSAQPSPGSPPSPIGSDGRPRCGEDGEEREEGGNPLPSLTNLSYGTIIQIVWSTLILHG